jgi:hypothetical protein
MASSAMFAGFHNTARRPAAKSTVETDTRPWASYGGQAQLREIASGRQPLRIVRSALGVGHDPASPADRGALRAGAEGAAIDWACIY